MRCDECKHWFVDDRPGYREWEAEAVGFGECKAVRERWVVQDEANDGVRSWETVGDEAEEQWMAKRRDALRAARAYVQDGSEYRAELYTAPDFFCALFEAKS